MKHRQPLDHLCTLRKEIATLLVVKCRMYHERVIGVVEPRLPLDCHFTETNYERVGLCRSEVRAKRLGCCHTSARIKLEDAINALNGRTEESNQLCLWLRCELNWLDNQIHLLDHRKGKAERTLARIAGDVHRDGGSGRKGKDVSEAENEIQELEQAHGEYVERIARLRDRIIIEIDKLIEPVMD
jgi:hypothetical protein